MNKLLVVDDDRDICEFVAAVAESLDYTVMQATSHEECKRHYGEFQPNFILMDLAMSDGVDVELFRYFAAEKCMANIALMSGFDSRVLNSAGQLGKEHGLKMVGNLSKPIPIVELEALLSSDRNTDIALTVEDLQLALQRGEVVPYFQPKVYFGAEESAECGVEALVRWEHPEKGLIGPDVILPLADSGHLLAEMTRVVVEATIQRVSEWQTMGLKIDAAVNVAPELLNNLGLPDEFAELARQYNVDPNQLMIEITESGIMENTTLAMDILTRFRLKEFGLSIDDFGTGFSSLFHLYRMPFNELKIDQSFVRDVSTDEGARVIVSAMTNLAHQLGLTVCAEGVEDEHVSAFIIECGCDKAQGYHFSRPVPGDEIPAFITSWKSQT